MGIQPYLFFNGRCEEAIAFYQQALSAELGMLLRFDEAPDKPPMPMPADWGQKVMHAAMNVRGTVVMASDGMCGDSTNFDGFCLSINATDAADAKRMFDALADGGQVRMPLGATFWSPCFGMVADRFGVGWMVGIDPTQAPV